jgi:predicted secreted protein
MMKKAILTLMTLVLLASSFACIDSGGNIVVTEDELDQAYATNNGVISRTITVNSGDTLTVTLYAHWSAGCKWSIGVYDRSILKLDGSREFINDGPSGSVGAPGREIWTFKALEEGVATITMTYGSVADLPDAPRNVNTLELTVEVKK